MKAYLEAAISRRVVWQRRWPPPGDAVYLVSRYQWSRSPTAAAEPLYIGGNTGASRRFCTRVGDLVADMFGFSGGGTGHHTGGQLLWKWCDANRVHPGDLWLGWATSRRWCGRCAETALYEAFPKAPKAELDDMKGRGLRNQKRPPRCKAH